MMGRYKEYFFNSSSYDISIFLQELYKNLPEGELISQLILSGKKILELPIDFEPYYLNKLIDLNVLAKRIEGFDYIILYHGTCLKFKEEILRDGLLPRKKTGNSNFKDTKISKEDSIYVGQLNYFGNIFDCVKVHAFQVSKKYNSSPLIVRCIIPTSKLLPDEDIKNAQIGTTSIILGGAARVKDYLNQNIFVYEFNKVTDAFQIPFHSFTYKEFYDFIS
ncbi:MAG: hypothetical protein LAT82_02715 [Nanoarchaeota archaeon]|nr:hypothetical protein [Nanoarchaeota archaeon]